MKHPFIVHGHPYIFASRCTLAITMDPAQVLAWREGLNPWDYGSGGAIVVGGGHSVVVGAALGGVHADLARPDADLASFADMVFVGKCMFRMYARAIIV